MKEIAKILKDNNCVMHVVPDYQIMVVENTEPEDKFKKVEIKNEEEK